MPPKKSKSKKNMSAKEEVPDIPQPPSPTAEAVKEYSEKSAAPPDDDECSEDNEEDYLKTKAPQFQPAVEQELADFYEGNPIFYDKSRSDFKNSKKKDHLLQEQAAALNPTGECSRLTIRFNLISKV